ncbi:MAG: XrtV sorting system accessory protein [Sphingopyxis sp.]
METIYDWVTMIVFAALVVLFLQRSTLDEPVDTIWHYLPPSVACAAANFAGNEGYGVVAFALLIGVGAYGIFVLKVGVPGAKP